MESINNTSASTFEQLSGKEKLEAILALFGTVAARENFVKNCKDYILARDKAIRESYAPSESVRRRAVTSGPKQALIHNRIMDTLTRLASQSHVISPQQREVLREMHNRDATARIIREYLVSMRDAEEDDEEAIGERKKGTSDTAYYRSLGKGG